MTLRHRGAQRPQLGMAVWVFSEYRQALPMKESAWEVWVPPGLGINGPCVTIRARCPHCSRAVPWRPSSPGSSPVNTWSHLVAGETGWWCASARVGEPRESGVGRSHLGQHTAGGELLLTLRVPGLPVGPWATALPLLPSWASSWRLLWLQYCF